MTDNISNKRIDKTYYLSSNEVATKAFVNLFCPFITDWGGVKNDISISIETREKEFKTSEFPNSKWLNQSRNTQELLKSNIQWIFTEATNPNVFSNAISNAFCFCGQKINIKIKQKGHIEGHFNNQWTYTTTNLTIKLTDVVNGTQETLKEFQLFETDIDDSSRWVQFTMPNVNNSAFENYGLFGCVVLELEVSYTLFKDAERKIRIEYANNITERQFLQIIGYSAANEALNVTSPFQIWKESLTGNETLLELFDKSVFNTYDGVNGNALSDEQKKAIISDQIAVLFISQHPVVTNENSPSKILGLGFESACKPSFYKSNIIGYVNKYPEIIHSFINRLYGLLGNYKTFAFSTELNKYISDLQQSLQINRDPTRIIAINKNGKVDFNFGTDGIIFNPYVIEHINAETPLFNTEENEFEINLSEKNVEIENLRVENLEQILSEEDGSQLIVAFSVASGEELIKQIRYSIWINNNLTWMEWVDSTGLTRSHSFQTADIGGTTFTDLAGDWVHIKVDIEDQYGLVNSFSADQFFPDNLETPNLQNLYCHQLTDGSGNIGIEYRYLGASELNNTKITLSYSIDDTTFTEVTEDIVGDIGYNVMPGIKSATWHPWNLNAEIDDVIYLKLSLIDIDGLADFGKNKNNSIKVKLNIQKPSAYTKKINEYEIAAMLESSSSSTSSSSSSSNSSSSSSSSEQYSSESSSSSSSWSNEIKNIIFLMGDGMDDVGVDATSIYKTAHTGKMFWELNFNKTISVTTENYTGGITDSAAGGTALATGFKVSNGTVSQSLPWGDGSNLKSILEYSKEQGKSTAILSTSFITDASPAAMAAHDSSRTNYSDIGTDFLNDSKPTVIMGGGGIGISISAAEAADYVAVDNKWEMWNLNNDNELSCALFGTGAFPYYYDGYDEDTPRFKDMVEKTLEILSTNENGFFLFAENENIDSAGHDTDTIRIINEILELEEGVEVAYNWAKNRNDTIIIVGTDHGTGNFTITSNNGVGSYPTLNWISGGHNSNSVKFHAWGPGADDLSGTHLKDIFHFMMNKLIHESSSSSSVDSSSSTSSVDSSSSSSVDSSSSSSSGSSSSSSIDSSSSTSSVDSSSSSSTSSSSSSIDSSSSSSMGSSSSSSSS